MTHRGGHKRISTLEKGTLFLLFVPCGLGMDAPQRASKPQADASPPSLGTPDFRGVFFRGVCPKVHFFSKNLEKYRSRAGDLHPQIYTSSNHAFTAPTAADIYGRKYNKNEKTKENCNARENGKFVLQLFCIYPKDFRAWI